MSVGGEEKNPSRIYSLPVHTVVSGGGGLMPSPADKGESVIPLDTLHRSLSKGTTKYFMVSSVILPM